VLQCHKVGDVTAENFKTEPLAKIVEVACKTAVGSYKKCAITGNYDNL